ncbi:hypothetical protein ACQ1Y7_14945, partial [Enterococcus faecalis]|uniref:hypothetical protein n=1 Tax=Enterococcus faecalis TaxID=1351 RepID=UPI003D6BDFF7
AERAALRHGSAAGDYRPVGGTPVAGGFKAAGVRTDHRGAEAVSPAGSAAGRRGAGSAAG